MEDYEIVDLISFIVTNIAEDNSDAFARSIMLMTGFDVDKVSKISTAELIKIFTSGILVNNIVELNKFCKEIRYA